MSLNNATGCFIEHDLDQFVFPLVYITVIVISIPTNSLSLYVSYKHIKRGNELGIYLFNLSVADLLYTLTLPLWVDYSLQHDNWKHGSHLCKLCSFLMYTNFYTSAAFLCCISIDRYLAVVYPLRFYVLRKVKTAIYVSGLIWAIELSGNIIILWHEETHRDHLNHLLCYDSYPLEKWKAMLNCGRFFIGFLLPAMLMVFCCQRIYKAIKSNIATQDHDKIKIKKLLLSIVVTFLICFTPYHIVMLIRSITEPQMCEVAKRLFVPYKITMALSSFNCIADPFLYSFVSESARTDMLTAVLIFKKKPRQSSGLNYVNAAPAEKEG
ncbi:G-protein coupled receptor 4-like [Acipenser ruthenus]|uniref:G-protein coupled receptor 4-like n=1 Tax=Acipenser ruthenus TaxID=7906 RepID=UPI00145B3764|nr:G-protein coupled receptor 4-like [Acipenser ruthenus]